MSLLEAERPVAAQIEGLQEDPRGSIFLPEQREVPTEKPALPDLIEAFFPDWERAETVMDAIAEFYPEQLDRVCDQIQTMLLLDRGPIAKDPSEGLVKLEIVQYLYELAESYRTRSSDIAS